MYIPKQNWTFLIFLLSFLFLHALPLLLLLRWRHDDEDKERATGFLFCCCSLLVNEEQQLWWAFIPCNGNGFNSWEHFTLGIKYFRYFSKIGLIAQPPCATWIKIVLSIRLWMWTSVRRSRTTGAWDLNKRFSNSINLKDQVNWKLKKHAGRMGVQLLSVAWLTIHSTSVSHHQVSNSFWCTHFNFSVIKACI